MKKIMIIAAIVGSMFIANSAEAKNPYTPKVDKRQYNQQSRIKHGVRHGQLTKHETRKLRMQQAKIRHYEYMAKADGRITPRERHILQHEQRKANKHIYRAKHNGRYY